MAAVFRNQRINQIVVLTAILAIAAWLRYASLAQRGLIYWDEAKFALEGERFYAYFQAIFGTHVSLNLGKSVGTAKPTHDLFIALGYLIFGIHAYTPLFVDAFCGVVEVGVVFLVGRRLFGPWVGLVAALFLAVSEYDIIYARSALSESDAALLFLIGVFLWVLDWERVADAVPALRGRPTRFLLGAGILAGASFTANYRLGVYIFALVVFDLIWAAKEHGWKPAARRLAGWIGGLITVPILWQIIDLIARASGHVLFRSEVNVIVKSGSQVIFKNVREDGPEIYLLQALFQIHGGKQAITKFDPTIYLHWFVLREGWVIPVLLLLGFWFTVRTRLFPWLAVACLIVVPYLIYINAPFIVPRNLSAMLPYVCLLAAAGFVTLAERIPSDVTRRIAIVIAGCVIASYGAWLAWPLTGERSGFAQASSYLHNRPGGVLATDEIMDFYLPGLPVGLRCGAPALPGNMRQLSADVRAGYHYAVTLSDDDARLFPFVSRHAHVLARWPAYGRISIGENPIKTENGDPPGVHKLEYVEVFSLSNLRLPRPGPTKPLLCTRNVPI